MLYKTGNCTAIPCKFRAVRFIPVLKFQKLKNAALIGDAQCYVEVCSGSPSTNPTPYLHVYDVNSKDEGFDVSLTVCRFPVPKPDMRVGVINPPPGVRCNGRPRYTAIIARSNNQAHQEVMLTA